MGKDDSKRLEKKKNHKKSNLRWSFSLMGIAALLSIILSFISEIAMRDVSLFIGTIVIVLFIGIGVLFDMIGVAVTSADEKPFHAMSSKRVKGAKLAVKLKKSSDRVSSFCCDVIGDICGIVSGAAGVAVAGKMTEVFDISVLVSGLIVTGLIAAMTIGGKALEKTVAITNGNKILYEFAKVLSLFSKR